MIWEKYLKCKQYLDEISLINRTNECWDFYLDNQWNSGRNRPLNTGGVNLPFLNYIKPTIKYQTSTIGQSSFMPVFHFDGEDDEQGTKQGYVDALNTLIYDEWRKGRQRNRTWRMIKYGLIQGDSYQYCGTDDPTDDQIIPNVNIMFGDESNPNIQEQPYILLRVRELVSKIKAEGKENGLSDEQLKQIGADGDKTYLIGDQSLTEVEEKCTAVIYLEKKNGIVNMGKSANGIDYVPLKPMANTIKSTGQIISGMTLYPVASFSPEQIINSARGQSFVRPMIPNQIEVNKTIVRRSEAVKIAAYPRIVFNGNAIEDSSVLDKAGVKIETNGSTDTVKGAVDYILPASTSSDASNLQNELLTTTRELNGSSNALSGAVDPTRVAAKTVMAMADLQALPLNEAEDNAKTFTADLAKIWIDMKRTYNPEGLVIGSVEIPSEELNSLELEVEIDVTKETPWTRDAEQAFLDNLYEKQAIDLEEYVDASPENGSVPKAKMKKLFEKRAAQQPQEPIEEQPQETANEVPMQSM